MWVIKSDRSPVHPNKISSKMGGGFWFEFLELFLLLSKYKAESESFKQWWISM